MKNFADHLLTNILARLIILAVVAVIAPIALAAVAVMMVIAVPIILLGDIKINHKYFSMSDRISWIPSRNDASLL